MEGTVKRLDYTDDHGDRIIIDNKNGYRTLYGHTSSYIVQEGEWIKKGQIIGYTGNSGKPGTKKHLHFALYKNGKSIDPQGYIK